MGLYYFAIPWAIFVGLAILLTFLSTLGIVRVFNLAILLGIYWYLGVDFICIIVITPNVKHDFLCLIAIDSFLMKNLWNFSSKFFIGWLSYYWIVWILYILSDSHSSHIYFAKQFLSGCGLPLCFLNTVIQNIFLGL